MHSPAQSRADIVAARSTAPRVDVHQHLWPAELLTALARRRAAPRLTRRDGDWVLVSEGEPDWVTDLAAHAPHPRRTRALCEGLDAVLVAPSCPIGIECLPPREAAPLLDAYHDGVAALGPPFRGWAAAALRAPDADALSDRLRAGFVGLCLPAGAFAVPDAVAHVDILLDVLERHDAPLFVHPGPAPWAPVSAPPAGSAPWWPALVTYVGQMHAAWHTVHAHVRPRRPGLRVLFAMLAGLAPLQAPRLARRGGSAAVADTATFYETSSYDAPRIAAVADVVGPHAIVHGSDQPVVAGDTPLPSRADHDHNAARLLAAPIRQEVQ